MKKTNVTWHINAWDDYLYWQKHNKKLLAKVNPLIEETLRDPFTGIGKPEPLKHVFEGYWSRRITQEHRLVYKPTNDGVFILQCRYHYQK